MAPRLVVVDMNHADASHVANDGKRFIDTADFKAAFKFGIRGIIHKASEGTHFIDPLYHTRKQAALDASMMWGAYHFMRPGDVGAQVSLFLQAVGASRQTDTRMVLDYEDPGLALWQAERWMELIHIATGQRPWLYSGFLVREQTERADPGPALSQYPLWLAEYSEEAKIPRPWSSYVLWQRSGDGEGPGVHDIPGIGRRQDVNYFDGTDEQLQTAWLDKGAGPTETA